MRQVARVTAIRAYLCDTGLGRAYVFVVVDTDAGVSGIGEASQSDQDAAVLANISQLAPSYVGHDVFELIERRSTLLRSGRSGRAMTVAISGIEIGLWDAIGKLLDTPVYRLLGGSCHDTLRCYATISAGVRDWSPDGLAREAENAVATGFDAVKVVPFQPEPGSSSDGGHGDVVPRGVARVDAVRRAVGDGVDIMIECAFGLDPFTAVHVADALAPFGCYWLEAPLRWDDPPHLAMLRQKTRLRIASGEVLSGMQTYRELIEHRAVDVIQPDVKWTGGILEAKKIAAWAEMYQIAVAAHNNSGPVATAASAHLMAGLPNALVLEVAGRQPSWIGDVVENGDLGYDGTINVADLASRPGLGVEIDEAGIAARATARFS